ncbi:MAG: hypothetical protein Ct9H300mP8_11700 [Gammaproteobacteria bacterium]|nr:MAG: hypothetical protein Ct9H300mP8_11700 [Gammaproteobacteria bacterium]
MVIASGGSLRHMRSLVIRSCIGKNEENSVLGVEGLPHGDWILVDLGEVVGHLMKPEARAFYELKRAMGRDQ